MVNLLWVLWSGWHGSQPGTREQSASESLVSALSCSCRIEIWGAEGKFLVEIKQFFCIITLFSCSVPWFNYRNNHYSSSHRTSFMPYLLGFQTGCIWYRTNFFSIGSSHGLINNNGYFLGLLFSEKTYLR